MTKNDKLVLLTKSKINIHKKHTQLDSIWFPKFLQFIKHHKTYRIFSRSKLGNFTQLCMHLFVSLLF